MEEKASKIKIFFLDVDGVMTDGRIIMDSEGEETKCFDVKDGLGLKMLMWAGVEVVLISGRASKVVAHRARDLGIDNVHQGVSDKLALCRQIINKKGLNKQEVCSMGDDLPDLAMFVTSGLRIAVADAVKEVREEADYITKNKGGNGAVRESCEWILKGKEKWTAAVEAFSVK